jgi:hypothetical protein
MFESCPFRFQPLNFVPDSFLSLWSNTLFAQLIVGVAYRFFHLC